MENADAKPVAANENADMTAQSAAPPEPIQATQPAQAAEPVMATQPAQAAEPVVATQPAQAAEPVATAQPAQAAEPIVTAQPAQATEPANPAENQSPDGRPVVEPISVNPDDEAELQLALKNLEERRKRKRRSRIIKIVVVCVIVAAIIAAWAIVNATNAQKQKEEAEASAALAALASMNEAPSSGVQASGTLKPGSSVLVTPEVSGIIQEVRVAEGQRVEAGAVLFTIKSDEAEKGLADAQTAVDRAQRGVSNAQADVAQAERDYDSALNSYNAAVDAYNNSIDAAAAAGKAAYDSTYQSAIAAIPSTATDAERKALIAEAEAQAQLAFDVAYQDALAVDPGSFDHSIYTSMIDAANSSVTTAQEALDDAQKGYERARALMEKCQVKSPRTGTVLSLKAVVGASVGGASGNTVGATSGEASALIGDLSTLEVDIEVNEIDVSGVRVGQRAEVTFPAFPDIQEEAEVASVAAAATNAASESGGQGGGIVTFTVKLVIKHPDDRLKAGMSANVRILPEDGAATGATSTTGVDAGSGLGSSAASSGSAS